MTWSWFCFVFQDLSYQNRIHVWIWMISLPTFTILLVNIPYMDPMGMVFLRIFSDFHIWKYLPTYPSQPPGSTLVWRDSFPTASRSTQKTLGKSGKISRKDGAGIGKHNQGFQKWMFPKIVGFPPKSSHFNRSFPWFSPSILGYPFLDILLGGGFTYIFQFSPRNLESNHPNQTDYFFFTMGWNHQLENGEMFTSQFWFIVSKVILLSNHAELTGLSVHQNLIPSVSTLTPRFRCFSISKLIHPCFFRTNLWFKIIN